MSCSITGSVADGVSPSRSHTDAGTFPSTSHRFSSHTAGIQGFLLLVLGSLEITTLV